MSSYPDIFLLVLVFVYQKLLCLAQLEASKGQVLKNEQAIMYIC